MEIPKYFEGDVEMFIQTVHQFAFGAVFAVVVIDLLRVDVFAAVGAQEFFHVFITTIIQLVAEDVEHFFDVVVVGDDERVLDGKGIVHVDIPFGGGLFYLFF
jgi:hypothetical protein